MEEYKNIELQSYLDLHYPKQGRLWKLMMALFINDFNKNFTWVLLQEMLKLDNEKAKEYFNYTLCNTGSYSAHDWIRNTDTVLHKLRKNYQDWLIVTGHFNCKNLQEIEDKITNICYGENYAELQRESIAKLVAESK